MNRWPPIILTALALLAGTPFLAASPESAADSQATGEPSVRELTAALLAETNRVRREHGRAALRPIEALNAAAADQANFNAITLTAQHASPIRGERDVVERVQRHGMRPTAVAENVAAAPVGRGRPASAAEVAAILVEQWMNSPGHRANLLSREFASVGVATRLVRLPGDAWMAYGVQVFSDARPSELLRF